MILFKVLIDTLLFTDLQILMSKLKPKSTVTKITVILISYATNMHQLLSKVSVHELKYFEVVMA